MTTSEDQSSPVGKPRTQEEFNTAFGYNVIRRPRFFLSKSNMRIKCSFWYLIRSLVPALEWLPRYNCRSTLLSDLVAGFTVAVIQVPQGMAYASLGNVNPIVGIHMAIFPALVYAFLGTSRHISFGTFAIVCLMSAQPVLLHSGADYSPAEVSAVIALTVGFLQIFLGVFRVGSISMFMSESLVSGFTNGAAILVVISQLQHVLGITVQNNFGTFSAIYTVIDVIKKIPNTNYTALTISITVIVVLFVYSDIIVPRLKCNFLVHIELLVMIIGTALSYGFDFESRYNIHIVGSIPTGVPNPKIPRIELIPKVLADSLIIAIISFSVQISLASVFAMKDNYKVRSNQEFIACGVGNMVGSLFSCLPMGTSLSRSMLQYTSGGKTQLASVFSCALLILVVLYFGKFLKPLPYSVLAGIVFKSLRTMLLQFTNLPTIWEHSAVDGALWLTTFLSVVILSIELGLAIALALALLTVVLLNQRVHVSRMGRVPNTDIYLEVQRYRSTKPVPGLIIAQVVAGLHFANVHIALRQMDMLLAESPDCHVLVLDLSAVVFIDPAALHCVQNYFLSQYNASGIVVSFANCSGKVYEQMKCCKFMEKFPGYVHFFPTMQDAVLYSLNRLQEDSLDEKNAISIST